MNLIAAVALVLVVVVVAFVGAIVEDGAHRRNPDRGDSSLSHFAVILDVHQ